MFSPAVHRHCARSEFLATPGALCLLPRFVCERASHAMPGIQPSWKQLAKLLPSIVLPNQRSRNCVTSDSTDCGHHRRLPSSMSVVDYVSVFLVSSFSDRWWYWCPQKNRVDRTIVPMLLLLLLLLLLFFFFCSRMWGFCRSLTVVCPGAVANRTKAPNTFSWPAAIRSESLEPCDPSATRHRSHRHQNAILSDPDFLRRLHHLNHQLFDLPLTGDSVFSSFFFIFFSFGYVIFCFPWRFQRWIFLLCQRCFT